MLIKMMGSKVLIVSKLCFTAALVSVVSSHSVFAQTEEPALQEVVVFGVKESLRKAIDLKRESGQLIDAISAEDIGKFPDLNIAESLARITGVQLSRGSDVSAGDSSGSGAGQQVSIRGIRPDLNRATINGQSLGTTTGGRNFNFQTLSPGLVSRLEVYKTPSASMTEGSLGGTVNMVTHQPLAIGKQRLNITGKMFDNQMADDTGELFAGLYSNVFLDGTFGVLLSYNYSDNTKRRDRYESFGWENNTTTSPASATPGVVGFAPRDIRHQIRIEAQKINGGNVALQWLPTENLELGLNYFFSELENHSYGPQTILQMFESRGGFDGRLAGDTFVTGSVDGAAGNPHRLAYFDRTYVNSIDILVLDAEWAMDDTTFSVSVGTTQGEQMLEPSLFFQVGSAQELAYDFGDTGLPNIKTTANAAPGETLDTIEYGQGLDFANASDYGFTALSNAGGGFKDKEDFFALDVDTHVYDSFLTAIKFGTKFRNRSNDTISTVDKTIDRMGLNLADFLAEPFTDYAFGHSGGQPSVLPNIDSGLVYETYGSELFDGVTADDVSRKSANSFIEESISAVYLQLDFEAGRARGDFGIRIVNTDQRNEGYAVVDGTDPADAPLIVDGQKYTDYLPSLNIRYDVSDTYVVRAGLSKTMSRSPYSELSIGVRLNQAALTGVAGNPKLEPYRANQFDLSSEWYFEEGGILSAAVFYKDVGSYVISAQVPEVINGNDFAIRTFENGAGASIMGLELAIQKNFDQLPGWLSGFGAVFNYTYSDSKTDELDNNGGVLPLEGLSENSFNAIAFWENDRFSTRVAYNYRDEFLVFSRSLAQGLPVYREDFGSLDFSMNYSVPKTRLSFQLEGTNLGDEKTVDYAGISERLVSQHISGRRFALGFRYRFY
ncbi:MAG: TonB-dependent receptor [Cellvibrionales bacterium]|nr:TonB-dependent receptor [Cellvibrionales bacterium]